MILWLFLVSALHAAPQNQVQMMQAQQTRQATIPTPTATQTMGIPEIRVLTSGDSAVSGGNYGGTFWSYRLAMQQKSNELGHQIQSAGPCDMSVYGDLSTWPFAALTQCGVPGDSQGTLTTCTSLTLTYIPTPTTKDVWIPGSWHGECTIPLDNTAFMARVRAIALSITAVSSNIQVFIPTAYSQPAYAACDAAMNTALAAVVTQLNLDGYTNVRLMDIAGAFPSPALLPDGLHPTQAQSTAIGEWQAQQIIEVLYP